jgi:ABC-type methionine transport system ATPase subunit
MCLGGRPCCATLGRYRLFNIAVHEVVHHKASLSSFAIGFLGAGKSTLVRHILTAQHGRRIAVIVNEFGEELGIERAIVNENDVSTKSL